MSSRPRSESDDQKRRVLDRAEARVLELERRLGEEMQRYGSTSYDMVITLATAFVHRARQREARGLATEEDLKILQRTTK